VPHLNSIEQHFKSKAGKGASYEVVGEVKGADMLGWEYVGPFDDLPAQQHEYGFPEEVAKVVAQRGWCLARSAAHSHRIISGGKDVTETEGTGIVHTAPGCGQIDFVWGKDNGLPPIAPIDDSGNFHTGFGPLTGKNAADTTTADAVFEELKKKDALFVTERYVHRYPHCWRCKTELLYRLVDEWFINMGAKEEWSARSASGAESARGASGPHFSFRHAIMDVVKNPAVKFLPESINGTARELDWLKNMGDWMISKKRFWGLALPIWVDDEDPTQFDVIGSFEELKSRAVEGWSEFDGHTPHRPWVDRIKIKNPKTGRLMSRIPDVGNPWLDAGIVAFSTMPTDWYPAEFITESFPGQFRNWFYALLAMSTMMSDGAPPFRNLLGHGLVRDQEGKEMHKSAGNAIEFNAAAEELGADAMRWLYCRANPAANLNFGPEPIKEVRAKFIIKLWNCYGFLCNYAALDGFDPTALQVPVKDRADIDRWILSDLQLLIKQAREAFESYNVMAFCLAAEEFVDAKLSNWYIRRNRDRFWSKNAELDDAGRRDKLAAYQTLRTVLLDLCRLCAPVVPFLSEVMWMNLRAGAGAESVHLTDYPTPVELDYPAQELSNVMQALLRLVSVCGAARNTAKHKFRQPLAEVKILPWGPLELAAVRRFPEQLREELNVKTVTIHDFNLRGTHLFERELKPNWKNLMALSRSDEVREAVNAGRVTLVSDLVPPRVVIDLGEGQHHNVSFEDVYRWKAPEGWAGVVDKGTQAIVDIRITSELKAEGMARDVVRLVQDERKKAGLDVADKIALSLGTESEPLKAAIAVHRDTIASETQAVQWSSTPLTGDGVHTAAAKIDGQALTIALRKV
jgi:isoleucyl-tRNA synthetase